MEVPDEMVVGERQLGSVQMLRTLTEESSHVINREKIEPARLHEVISTNTRIILDHQDSTTGLFPAATLDRRLNEGHYGDAWVRDTAAILKGFLYVWKFTEDANLKAELGASVVKSLNGLSEIVSGERWQRGFRQRIIDENGYTRLTEEAPPIHLKMDGVVCEWPQQNQPDSWGSYLYVEAQARAYGIFKPTLEQKKSTAGEVEYLLNIHPERFSSSSMWEDAEVRDPSPVSSALIIEEGLNRIKLEYLKPDALIFEKELVPRIDRRINAIADFVSKRYPEDLTWLDGHRSRTDLATLVAFGYSDRGHLSLTQYMTIANLELGNGNLPGKIRFAGDPYYYDGVREYWGPRDEPKEAVWFMSLPLEAIIFSRRGLRAFNSGNNVDGAKFMGMSNNRLARSLDVGDRYGFYPELFMRKDGVLVPNENDLLWNRALMIDAAVMTLELDRIAT